MGKEIFNERRFLQRADEIREQLGITREDFCQKVLGRTGSAYRPLMDGKEHVSIDALIRICQLLKIRLNWALCGEEPVTETEATALASTVDSIEKLAAYAQRVVEQPRYAPPPPSQLTASAVAALLDKVIQDLPVEYDGTEFASSLQYARRRAHLQAALPLSRHQADLNREIDEEIRVVPVDEQSIL